MVKDNRELNCTKQSSQFSSQVMKHLQKQLENTIEEEAKKKHEDFSSELYNLCDTPKKVKSQLKAIYLEAAFDPIIQSGGEYNLKYTARSTKKDLHYDYGTICCILGYRFRNYCSGLARTFLIDPSKDQQKVY